MKSNSRISLFPILIFYLSFLISCNNEQKPSHEHTHEDGTVHSHPHEHDHEHDHVHDDEHDHTHEHESNAVVLNNGEKWQANPETTNGIKAMQVLVQDFIDGNSGTEYESLAEDLQGEFNLIFQKCTMTGEAHDQLHNYLLPMKEMFEGLTSEDEALRQEKLAELADHLNEYHSYFE